MSEYDGLVDGALSERGASTDVATDSVDAVSPSPRSENAREDAIERGRILGEAEADSRGEIGSDREERVRRAKAFSAWEFDGKPSGDDHMKEFGVTTEITPSLERAIFGRLLKKERK